MIGIWNYGTGRRKSSVARVFIKKGTGLITVNGKTVDEMIYLITTQRAYEMNSKVIQTADQLLQKLTNLR